MINKDPYSLFRHTTFHYVGYYLHDFFHTHHITKDLVRSDCGFGGETLEHLIEGKDMNFNCYLRLLTVMGEYCPTDEEYMQFLMGFMKRAIIEVWLKWEERPFGWMLEIWEEMQKEKEQYMTQNS